MFLVLGLFFFASSITLKGIHCERFCLGIIAVLLSIIG